MFMTIYKTMNQFTIHETETTNKAAPVSHVTTAANPVILPVIAPTQNLQVATPRTAAGPASLRCPSSTPRLSNWIISRKRTLTPATPRFVSKKAPMSTTSTAKRLASVSQDRLALTTPTSRQTSSSTAWSTVWEISNYLKKKKILYIEISKLFSILEKSLISQKTKKKNTFLIIF